MKSINKIRYAVISALVAAGASGSMTSCTEDVAMPGAYITLSTDTIKAPAIASAYAFEVQANCDWSIVMEGGEAGWAYLSSREATGTANVTLELTANASDAARTLVLNIANRSNSAVSRLVIVQNSGNAAGYLTVKEVRDLAKDGSYTFNTEARMRAIVVSEQRSGNYPDNRLAVISSLDPGNGITLCTDEAMMVSPGDEIEVDLNGATVATSKATGFLELKAESDAKVQRTTSTPSSPSPIAVTSAQLASGDYDGMLVQMNCQVLFNDLSNKSVSPTLTLQEPDGGQAMMGVLPTSAFSSMKVPTGSGKVTGVVARYSGQYCIMPRSAADIVLDSQRYDGGITLPYIFSFMTEGANQKGRYSTYVSDSEINNCKLITKDGTGVTFSLNLAKSSKFFNFWTDTSGHHNIQLGTWADGPSNYIVYMFPLGQDLGNSFRLTFGMGSQRNAPAHWVVMYSKDTQTWYPVNDDEITYSLPIGSGNKYEYTGGKNYFDFTVDVKNLKTTFARKDNLYIMFRPYDKVSISGGTVSGSYGRSCMHSGVIIEEIPSFTTSKPAGAVYFEAFDANTEGIDFRYGDKICALLNYCGSDISKWNVKNGMSGTNVRQRPGYAQIGYVESNYTPHTAYKNEVGVLNTPAFGATGSLKVTLKAMAYKNWASFDVASNPAPDRHGDLTSAVIEVVGGGTINGATTALISGMDYSQFKNYEFEIDGATVQTSLRFTSTPESGQFSRWFIDEICVTK